MLGSYWGKFAKITGLGAAVVFALLLIYLVGYAIGTRSGYYGAEAEGYAAQYPQETGKQVNDCFELTARADVAQCVDEAIEASRENQRGERVT